MESSPRNRGQLASIRILIGILRRIRIGRIIRLAVRFRRGHQLRSFPTISAQTIALRDGGLMVWAPHLDILILGHLKRETFRQHDERAWRREMLCPPKLARSLSLIDSDVYLIFQRVAGGEGPHGHMLFLQVAVEGSLAGDCGRHIHRIGGRRVHRGAIRLMHPHQRNVRRLIGCRITEREHAELPCSSFGLQADPNMHDALPRAVRVHAYRRLRALKHERFLLQVVRRRCFGRSLTKGGGRQNSKEKQSKRAHTATDIPQAA